MRYIAPLAALAMINICPGEEPPAQLPVDCSKGSVRALWLGMPLKEVEAAHEILRHGPNWF